MKYLIAGHDYLKKNPEFKLVGRDADLKRLSSVLLRNKAASVLLVGPGGVGATAICMGLEESKNNPDAPFDIVEKRIFWLETDELISSGEIDTGFAKVIEILRRTPDSILIIEDARDFIEGLRNAGASHVINSLNSAVKNGYTQVILEVRDDDLEMVLKAHSDMRQCYTMIDLNEPIGDALVEITKANARSLERHHKIKIEEDAILTAIDLTNKYRTRDLSLSRAQPERSHNLLDRALATYRLDAHKIVPQEDQDELKALYKLQRDGEIAIIEIDDKIEQEIQAYEQSRENNPNVEPESANRISAFSRMMAGAGGGSATVRALKEDRASLEKAIAENKDKFEHLTQKINANLVLSKDLVLAAFSRLSGIPANKLNENEREKLKNLSLEMKKSIFGQDEIVDRLTDAVKIARVGRRNGSKPQASFMFLGPSGTGKTFIAKTLAQNLLDDEAALTRFDMSEYMEKHSVSKLIGAPAGYEGFEMGGILTNAMRKNPHRIVLFDEIEKAHPDVFNLFLQILSDGRLTDNRGLTVSFAESIVIMTSNIGQPELLDTSMTVEERQHAALEVLVQTPGIRPEFLNRFAGRQNILFFNALSIETIAKIVRREINQLDAAYKDAGVTIIMPDDVVESFCKDLYDPQVGARGLPGFIQANLEPIIANTILENPTFKGTFKVGYDTANKRFTTVLE